MKRCLSDRNLLLVHYGEGRAAHRAHLEVCSHCAARYQRLVGDLELIGHALERMPAAITVHRGSSASRRRWAAVAAVVAAVVALTGVEVWVWRDTQVLVRGQQTTAEADTLRFLAEVSAAFPDQGDEETSLLQPVSRVTDPEVALDNEDEGSLGEMGEVCADCSASEGDTSGGNQNGKT